MEKEIISAEKLLEEIIFALDESQLYGLLTLLGFDTPAGITFAEKMAYYKQINHIDLREIPSSIKLGDAQYSPLYSALIKFINRKGLKDSKVYNAVGINRTIWYRLRDNKTASTSKQNILKFALVLELDYWEAFYLISLAGFSFLPTIDKTDYVIMKCILEKTYDPETIDEMLRNAGESTLFSIID